MRAWYAGTTRTSQASQRKETEHYQLFTRSNCSRKYNICCKKSILVLYQPRSELQVPDPVNIGIYLYKTNSFHNPSPCHTNSRNFRILIRADLPCIVKLVQMCWSSGRATYHEPYRAKLKFTDRCCISANTSSTISISTTGTTHVFFSRRTQISAHNIAVTPNNPFRMQDERNQPTLLPDRTED